MGKTHKSLTIGLIGIRVDEPSIDKMIKNGHSISVIECDNTTYDVIIGPRCWRIDPKLKLGNDQTDEDSLERQLEMMKAGIRAVKYPKETK